MTALFGFTLALGAALLFSAQPMVARMALPSLGGSPSVWNACMLFFQAAVLVGYALAHGLARPRRWGWAGLGFLAVILLGMLSLPLDIRPGAAGQLAHPLRWLLSSLAAVVAIPAVALAVTSPLLQRWFRDGSGTTRDPYFLYAASNAGSLTALIAYPLLVEPWLDLSAQSRVWAWGYAAWALLVGMCGWASWRGAGRRPPEDSGGAFGAGDRAATGGDEGEVHSEGTDLDPREAVRSLAEPGWRRWLVWMGLGAVPASLLQGCTLFLTTDVASIPLLWVVPLALYLISFVVVFARRGPWAVRAASRGLPYLAVGMAYMILVRATQPVWALIALHLGFLLTASVVCHGRLVSLRPAARELTGFYLAMSVGGVVGGGFSALLAPVLFDSVMEYPLAMAACCLALRPRAGGVAERPSWVRDIAWAVTLVLLVLVLALVVPWLTEEATRVRDLVVFGVPTVACCTLLDRPRRLAWGLAAVLVAGLWVQTRWAGTFHAERNFFGVTRVARSGGGEFHQLVHGNTIHGREFRDPSRQGIPLTYYHRKGPLGTLFSTFGGNGEGRRRVGVIGLGVGSMAAYARPEEEWDFYEIDPAVIRVARDPAWFTFLGRCRAGAWRIVEGDARLRLAEAPDAAYDLLVLDAFSSDAIPVHLLTREALALYRAKLRPGGWLLAHISNRYLNLEPVLAALAEDAG